MANSRRSIIGSVPAIAAMLIGLVPLILVVVRWRDNGRGSLLWPAASVAMCAIRALLPRTVS